MTSLTAAVLAALYGAPCLADGGVTASHDAVTVGSDSTADPGSAASSATTAAAPPNSAANEPAADASALQEVMVTATRRTVNAQDLPISITAISGDQLQQQGIEDIAGLAQSIAGVNYTDKGAFGGVNGSTLIIRGLNSEQTAGQLALASPVVPPVATYVDDTPLFFNLQLQDLDRVEILRGPQGTLYGSGSLGGTIRFVQNAPDPSQFDARAEVGASDTAHTHAGNEEAHGMLNIPLAPTLAIRLNGGYSYDAGFINQPNLYVLNSEGAPASAIPGDVWSPPYKYSEDGTNHNTARNARVSVLWKPNDTFHAQLNYYYQQMQAGGFPYAATQTAAYNNWISPATQPSGNFVNPPLVLQLYSAPVPAGVDSLSNADNAPESATDKVGLGSLTLEDELGFATITSTTSYSDHLNRSTDDLTALYTNFSFYQSLYGQNPRSYVIGHDELDDRPWAEELRLSSKTGGVIDWVAGAFYRYEKTNIQEHEYYPGYLDFYNQCEPIYGQSSGNGVSPSYCGVGETAYTPGMPTYVDGIPIIKDQTYIGDFETKFRDMAAYGDVTWHITKDWSLTGGTRVFKQDVTQAQQTGLLFDGGPFFGDTPPIANSSLSATWSRALWKVNTSYQLNDKNLVYATWSQGFRRGGVNALPTAEPGEDYVTPPALTKLSPDTVDNYEVGVKGTFANRFRYSAAVFDMQWHNVQEGVQLTPLVLPASLNVGQAVSRGVELETFALLSSNFNAQIDYTYDQTKLTELNPLFVFPNVSAPPPAIGSPLPGTPKDSLAVTLEYVNAHVFGWEMRYDIITHYQSALLPALSATVPTVAGYTMLDTRVSFQRSHWTWSLYLNNVTNTLGIQSYSDPALYGNRFQAIVSTPRTVGMTLYYALNE
jgi:iron complex outermembrane recepter protein